VSLLCFPYHWKNYMQNGKFRQISTYILVYFYTFVTFWWELRQLKCTSKVFFCDWGWLWKRCLGVCSIRIYQKKTWVNSIMLYMIMEFWITKNNNRKLFVIETDGPSWLKSNPQATSYAALALCLFYQRYSILGLLCGFLIVLCV